MQPRLALISSAILASLLMCGLLASPAAAGGAQLCFANETPCSSDYGPGSKIEMALVAGTKLKKYSPSGETLIEECASLSASGTSSNTGGETTPVEIPLKTLVVGSCTGLPCTTTVLEPGSLSVESIPGTMNGKVRWAGFKFTETCGSPWPGTCVVASEASKGITLKGGGEALLKFEAVTIPKASGTSQACMDKKWTGTLAISSPKPLYVSGPTSLSFPGAGTLCSAKEFNGVPCFFGKRFGAGTPVSATLKSGTASVLNAGFANIECEGSAMNGELLDPGSSTEPVVGAWSSWTFSGCNCSVSAPKAGDFSVDWSSGSDGALVLSGFEIKANCGGKECVFGGSINEGITLLGGSPAMIKAVGAPVAKQSGVAECESSSKWTAEYEVTAPKPLYVAKE